MNAPMFQHGQLRLYLLAALDEKGPMSGYDLIRALERQFDGLYSPSAGTVYPRLAKMEEEGLISRQDEGRRSIYSLTDAGRAELAERADEVDGLREHVETSSEQLADDLQRRIAEGAAHLSSLIGSAAAAAKYRTDHADDFAALADLARARFLNSPWGAGFAAATKKTGDATDGDSTDESATDEHTVGENERGGTPEEPVAQDAVIDEAIIDVEVVEEVADEEQPEAQAADTVRSTSSAHEEAGSDAPVTDDTPFAPSESPERDADDLAGLSRTQVREIVDALRQAADRLERVLEADSHTDSDTETD